MVPPHDSPTFQAVSSATPNSSIFDLPLSITSMASVTTAPSTQPPDTEPRKLPSWSMTRLEPTGRGAEPQVSTTVASATPRPCRRQSSAALRMSSSRASMGILRCVGPNMGCEAHPGNDRQRQCLHNLAIVIPAERCARSAPRESRDPSIPALLASAELDPKHRATWVPDRLATLAVRDDNREVIGWERLHASI